MNSHAALVRFELRTNPQESSPFPYPIVLGLPVLNGSLQPQNSLRQWSVAGDSLASSR